MKAHGSSGLVGRAPKSKLVLDGVEEMEARNTGGAIGSEPRSDSNLLTLIDVETTNVCGSGAVFVSHAGGTPILWSSLSNCRRQNIRRAQRTTLRGRRARQVECAEKRNLVDQADVNTRTRTTSGRNDTAAITPATIPCAKDHKLETCGGQPF